MGSQQSSENKSNTESTASDRISIEPTFTSALDISDEEINRLFEGVSSFSDLDPFPLADHLTAEEDSSFASPVSLTIETTNTILLPEEKSPIQETTTTATEITNILQVPQLALSNSDVNPALALEEVPDEPITEEEVKVAVRELIVEMVTKHKAVRQANALGEAKLDDKAVMETSEEKLTNTTASSPSYADVVKDPNSAANITQTTTAQWPLFFRQEVQSKLVANNSKTITQQKIDSQQKQQKKGNNFAKLYPIKQETFLDESVQLKSDTRGQHNFSLGRK